MKDIHLETCSLHAFEAIDRSALLKKLKRCGRNWTWFIDYLTNRHQTSNSERRYSRYRIALDFFKDLCCVRYDSHFSSMMWSRYSISASSLLIVSCGERYQWTRGSKINGELFDCDEWLKCSIEMVNRLKIGEADIERDSEIKYLGCVIDQQLNYNATVLLLSDTTHENGIQNLQNKCMKSMLKKTKNNAHGKELFYESNFLSVQPNDCSGCAGVHLQSTERYTSALPGKVFSIEWRSIIRPPQRWKCAVKTICWVRG